MLAKQGEFMGQISEIILLKLYLVIYQSLNNCIVIIINWTMFSTFPDLSLGDN